MRRFVLASLVWAFAGGGGAAAAAGAPPPPVVIDASVAQPAHMATYRGPDGAPIPVGACGAVIEGHVWVLPCSDPRVMAYRTAAAARAAQAAHRARDIESIAALALGAAAGAAAEWIHRRRLAPGTGV